MNNNRFVSAEPSRDTEAQWRVVGELLNEQSSPKE